jgi:hypothetical protein
MDKATLVAPDQDRVQRGSELLEAVGKAGFPIHAALWLYSSERYGDWRLVIASPLVDQKGPLAAYRKLNSVLRKNRPDLVLWLQCIQLVSPKDSLIRDLDRTYFQREATPRISSISGSTAGSSYIEQAHLYWPQGMTQ